MSSTNGSMALIENIYFSVQIDENDTRYKQYFKEKIEPEMEKLKLKSLKEETFIYEGIEVIGGIQRYPYGYKVKDKFRIYFASNYGSNYPIYIIVDAVFLHLNDVDYVLDNIKETLIIILKYFDTEYQLHTYNRKLSRVDICNHNTFINLNTFIKPNEYNRRTVTKLKTYKPHIEGKGEYDQETSYFRYQGEDWLIRFYNKTKEVIEQQYKAWFLPRWLDYGLIDKRTYDIYEMCYKLNKDYRLDFMYSHLIYDITVINKSDLDLIFRIYHNDKISKDDKYEEFKILLKKYKIKIVKEIVNVEFQLSHGYLSSLKIIDPGTGEYIDFTCIERLIENMNILYEHLTTKSFRVVKRKSNYKKKSDKEIDPLWERVIKSKIINIKNIDENKKEIYRTYNNQMNKEITVRDSIQKIAHLVYLISDEINTDIIDNISITDSLDILKSEYMMNENYYNLKDKLKRQIKIYGEKK